MLLVHHPRLVEETTSPSAHRTQGNWETLGTNTEMARYRWNILGLRETRWKNFGETTTEEEHKVFFSGKEDQHEHGVGFFVHKDIVNTHGMSPSLQQAHQQQTEGSSF